VFIAVVSWRCACCECVRCCIISVLRSGFAVAVVAAAAAVAVVFVVVAAAACNHNVVVCLCGVM